jgi:uncharacterized PurR-regulated membrane protein YhhQ (DUF165 family)
MSYSLAMRRFRYLDALTTAFVVILLVSNLVAQKLVRIGPFTTSGAMLLFRRFTATRLRAGRSGWVSLGRRCCMGCRRS